MVRKPAVLSLQRQDPGADAGQPSGSLWALLPFPHQPLQNLLLQVTLLAAQTSGNGPDQSLYIIPFVWLSFYSEEGSSCDVFLRSFEW